MFRRRLLSTLRRTWSRGSRPKACMQFPRFRFCRNRRNHSPYPRTPLRYPVRLLGVRSFRRILWFSLRRIRTFFCPYPASCRFAWKIPTNCRNGCMRANWLFLRLCAGFRNCYSLRADIADRTYHGARHAHSTNSYMTLRHPSRAEALTRNVFFRSVRRIWRCTTAEYDCRT